MKADFTIQLRNRREGFSLVEVTLALAVIAIGLIAIIGLLPHGLQASRDAADNTIAATIAQDIFSEIRIDPFNAVNICPPPCVTHNLRDSTSEPDDVINYDKSGFYVPAGSPNSYFNVRVSYQLQPTPRLWQVRATVVWPAQSAAPINTNIFVTQVAWYDRP
jgi:uncharacterized protein (TIGR02598 family)